MSIVQPNSLFRIVVM